jgi:ATP-dependent Clp protease ATP-binding subunit ClpA
MYAKFTPEAKQILLLADQEAKNLNHFHLTPEMIILAVLKSESEILKDIKYDVYCEKMIKIIGKGQSHNIIQTSPTFQLRRIYNELSKKEIATFTDLVNAILDEKKLAHKIISEIKREQLYRSKMALFYMLKNCKMSIPSEIFMAIIQKI